MKPSLNVGTLGSTDHGKTTLTAAICHVLAKTYGGQASDFDSIDNAPAENDERGIAINVSRVDYKTPTRHYLHTDCPTHRDSIKNLIAGSTIMDAAILVVAATDGVMPETRNLILSCRQVGVRHIIVFMNKCDMVDDEDLLEVIEMETRELLSEYGFPGDDLPVILGSALKALEGVREWEAKIIELATALDNYIPEPEPAEAKPFLLPIEDVFTIEDGTVIKGSMERGILRVGEEVEIVGITETSATTCMKIDNMSGQFPNEARAGQSVGVLLGIERDQIERGQVLAKPGSISAYTQFEAIVYILLKEEGGRHTPFFKGYRPQWYFRTTDITGNLQLPEGVEMVFPGDNIKMVITLIAPVAMEEGLRFTIREGGRTVGAGVVSQVIS